MNNTSETSYECDIIWIKIPQSERQIHMPILISLNSLIGAATCFMNIVSIFALKRYSDPQHMILINLCVTDLCTGFLVQPLYITFLTGLLLDVELCNVLYAILIIFHLVTTISFLTLVFAVIDRYISIFYPFRYHTTITHKRVCIFIVVSWISGLVALTMHEIDALRDIAMIASVAFFGSCCVFFIATHLKIFILACRVKKEIEDTNKRYNSGQSGVRTFRVPAILVLLCGILFTPYCTFSTVAHLKIDEMKATAHAIVNHWLFTLVLVNSLLDPVCYCLLNSKIKAAIVRFLHRGRSQAQHVVRNQQK